MLQHLRRVLEALVLQQPLHQFAPRIFRSIFGPRGRARQQHLALDVDQQRGRVDKLARHIHIARLQLVHIGQKLRRDLANRNVVDVDVLLANQVQQQVERPVIHLAHHHRKWRLLRRFLGLLRARPASPVFSPGRRRRRQHQFPGCALGECAFGARFALCSLLRRVLVRLRVADWAQRSTDQDPTAAQAPAPGS